MILSFNFDLSYYIEFILSGLLFLNSFNDDLIYHWYATRNDITSNNLKFNDMNYSRPRHIINKDLSIRDKFKYKLFWKVFYKYDARYSTYQDFQNHWDLNTKFKDIKSTMELDYLDLCTRWEARKLTLLRFLNIRSK